jgi:hypothetical protein
MSRKSLRFTVVLFLVLAISFGGMTLLAKPGGGKGFRPCPWPPCMAPCIPDYEPTVLCKTDNGMVATTWACCCCGGGGNHYKPLK